VAKVTEEGLDRLEEMALILIKLGASQVATACARSTSHGPLTITPDHTAATMSCVTSK
jgi:hypothetical protein